jgi:outer membrane biosynthesis protein TonB
MMEDMSTSLPPSPRPSDPAIFVHARAHPLIASAILVTVGALVLMVSDAAQSAEDSAGVGPTAPVTVTLWLTPTPSPTPTLTPTPTPTPTLTPSPSPSPSPAPEPEPAPPPAPEPDRHAYYKNCDAARAAGAAPILRGEPGYRSGLDRDDDGIACEWS